MPPSYLAFSEYHVSRLQSHVPGLIFGASRGIQRYPPRTGLGLEALFQNCSAHEVTIAMSLIVYLSSRQVADSS